jgi:hypothetical protein
VRSDGPQRAEPRRRDDLDAGCPLEQLEQLGVAPSGQAAEVDDRRAAERSMATIDSERSTTPVVASDIALPFLGPAIGMRMA